MKLQGKTVVITGASRGIGAATAREFAKAGANVALLARNADAIGDLAAEIGKQAIAIPCDVSRYWEVEKAVEATISAFGGLDVLIGNADAFVEAAGPLLSAARRGSNWGTHIPIATEEPNTVRHRSGQRCTWNRRWPRMRGR